jgi:coenzyme F420 hydrogenase subunit beta
MIPLNEIWQNEHCVGCGACAAICQEQIIESNFIAPKGVYKAGIPSNNIEKCTDCNRCFEVCPAVSRNAYKDNIITIPSTLSRLIHWLIGAYKGIYTGYAVDKNLRYECSSGGVATALLKYLLETKNTDATVVAAPIPDKPIRHHACLVEKAEDVIKCKGSIYCQVDYSSIWQFIQKNNQRLAIIGLPCQLKAVDLFMAAKGLDTSKIFKIGLFCGGMTSHKALDFLCKRANVNPDNVLNIRYRSGGWPGRKMIVTVCDIKHPTGTKEVVLFDRDASLFQRHLYNFCFGGHFFLNCCRRCEDQTAEYADISLGDAWLSEFTSSDTIGTNLVIARTAKGLKILQSAVCDGILELNHATPEDIVHSQGNCLVGRKLGLWGKSFWDRSSDTSELKVCKQYIPQYVPSTRLVLERRLFQWMVTHAPAHIVFVLFIIYNLMLMIGGRLFKWIQFKIRRRA